MERERITLWVCQGMSRLTTLFNKKYYFKGNTQIIRNFIRNCPTCRVNNPLPPTVPPLPKPIRSHGPYSRLQIDLIDMAPRKKAVYDQQQVELSLHCQCCAVFPNFAGFFPIQTNDADYIYSFILYVFFQREGCSDILQSDNGSEFIADIISKVCHDFGVRVIHGRQHHPQSEGQIENQNKVAKKHLARYLQILSPKAQAACWPMFLPFVVNVINNTPSTTTNDIPFRLYKNKEPKSFIHYIVPEDQIVKISVEEKMEEDGTFSENDLKVGEVLQSVSENELLHSANELSASSITQSCAGLTEPLFAHRKITNMGGKTSKEKSQCTLANHTECENSEEPKFSSQSFNLALLQINDEQNVSRLQALEAT